MTMTTDTPPPTKSRAGAAQLARANAKRQLDAATKAAAEAMRRLRWLDDATLAKLGDAARFEQLIRAQAATIDDDGDGER
jgi:hypothetical protein